MAQYGHNWYGSSYYGNTNAFSGWYQTKEIFTDEALEDAVVVKMRATLPSATYGPKALEVQQVSGTWREDAALGKISSNSANAKLKLVATSDEIVIKYEQRTIGAKVKIKVTTTEAGETPVVHNYTLNTQSTSVNANATYKISGLPFAQQEIEITMASDTPAGADFNFKGFSARTANIIVESRARAVYNPSQAMPDSMYVKLEPTITPISGSDYLVEVETPDYTGMKYVQLKVHLASSDNETTPEVDYIELTSGDTNNRTKQGFWTGVYNMAQIASVAGVSFKQVEEVVWTETIPSATSLTIRSQSGLRDTVDEWSIQKVTVPYKQGTKRIRLKEGFSSGWIDSPFIAPASKQAYTSTVEWISWNDQSYLPPDKSGVSVTYDFISIQKDNVLNPYVRIVNPMEKADRNLAGNKRLKNLDHVVRITLSRTAGKQTPVVDWIDLESKMYYQQDVNIENQEFSAVDFNNTGKGIVLDMNPASFRIQFTPPVDAGNPTYELIDNTGRPQDVLLYLDSEKNAAIRSNRTTTLSNKVWAQAKVRETKAQIGLPKHYQYGGGQVSFPLKDEIQMAPIFTGIIEMNPTIRYRYHLQTGWPQQQHKAVKGDSLNDIANIYGITVLEITNLNPKIIQNNDGTLLEGQSLQIPNDSINPNINIYWKSTNNERTSKSSQNAVLEGKANVESDIVTAEVNEASIYGWVDWVSEEKIHDGVVNMNDIARDYKRTHTASESGESIQLTYVAVQGDTFKKISEVFGVYEEDVRYLNGVLDLEVEPVVDQVIQIPSRITLPEILPEAVVDDNPYHVEIVYNSVRKKDGKVLPSSVMTIQPIQIAYKEVEREVELTRGNIQNGKDLIPNARVTHILSVKSSDGMVTYNKWDEDLRVGNFKLTGNFVDWSPEQSEPAAGTKYTVRFVCQIPSEVTISIQTSYQEEGGVDRIWRSPEVKEFNGMCFPGKDYVAELPNFEEWMGLPNNKIEDIQYLVEDNDIWVKTWVEKRAGKWYIIGSLQDRVPKDNWFPTIKTGYYYLGKEEFYLFNEPIIIEPTEREIPIAKNVEYVEGKFQNAAKIQEGSENLVRNSGFDVATENKQVVYKLTF